MPVKGNHKKVNTKPYTGPIRIKFVTDNTEAVFLRFLPKNDHNKQDKTVFVYDVCPPVMVRGKALEGGKLGKELPLTNEQLNLMQRRGVAIFTYGESCSNKQA